jgi:hypothetical protein
MTVSRLVLALVLASQLALGAEPGDGGTPLAIAVESATLRPLDTPTVPVDVGPGVYLPEGLAVEVAAKTAAYDAAAKTSPSPLLWIVLGSVMVGIGGGFAIGWVAANAARPTAAQ